MMAKDPRQMSVERHDDKWKQINNSKTTLLSIHNFPWPPLDVPTFKYVFQVNDFNDGDKKKKVMRMLLRWHSDKFSSIRGRLVETEKKFIEEKALEVAKFLTGLLQT